MTAVRPVWSGMLAVVHLDMSLSYNDLSGADAPFDDIYSERTPRFIHSSTPGGGLTWLNPTGHCVPTQHAIVRGCWRWHTRCSPPRDLPFRSTRSPGAQASVRGPS